MLWQRQREQQHGYNSSSRRRHSVNHHQQQQHHELADALVRFYTRHNNPAKIPGVPAVVARYIHRQDELNRSLVELYGEGLASAHKLHEQQASHEGLLSVA
jgi:hypothetical protein